MVMCSWRAVLGEGSELGNGPNPEYPPHIVVRTLLKPLEWRRGGGGMLINCQMNRGMPAVFISVH